MNKMDRFLIVGSGGREAVFASRLAEDSIVYAVLHHENPGIVSSVVKSGGAYTVGDADDPGTVVDFATLHDIDYAFVNADLPLANGVVDALLRADIKAIGGTRDAARIEWDKIHSIKLMQKRCPEFTPFHIIARDNDDLDAALAEFKRRGLDVVVKPQGLTGGKGVKVMPEHLKTYGECADYAAKLVDRDGCVLLVERLEGIEFTIMGLTDGTNLVLAPASYDYPFRYEGDHGPGTGGMGCFTSAEHKLPFMSDADLRDCHVAMGRMVDELASNLTPLCGILNGGFFKTRHGIRFMEYNCRFGDPEGINVLSVLEGSFSALLKDLWYKNLSETSVSFAGRATVVKYLVAAEYPDASADSQSFCVDTGAVSRMGVKTVFASCIHAGTETETGIGTYETLKKSRVVAFCAISDSIEAASGMVDAAINGHVRSDLQYRRDIGSRESLARLEDIANSI